MSGDEEWTTWIDMETVRDGPSWALILAAPLFAVALILVVLLLVTQ